MRLGIYAGAFDPITAGHISVIERAARLLDQLTVLVAVNPSKSTLFTTKERLEMIADAVAALPNVRVASTKRFVVEFARKHQAKFLIRGLRGATDIEYETAMADANLALAPEIATIFIPAQPELSKVSSSRLKELARTGASISGYCTKMVSDRLFERLNQKALNRQEVSYVGI
jgi:pantetheine-phosphate adenylyltransferase